EDGAAIVRHMTDTLARRRLCLEGGHEPRLHELARADVELLVDDPAAHTADAPAPHDELLHGRRQLVGLDAEHVDLDSVGQHDGTLLEHVLERLDAIADLRGALVLESLCGILHLALQQSDHAAVVARHERHELVDDLTMLLDRDLMRARAAATPDLAWEAGTPGLHGALVARVRTGADRECADHQVDRLAYGPHLRIRPEIARSRDAVVARDHDARRLVGERHGHVGVALVVTELDVVGRSELLDPGVFQLQSLDVAAHDRPLDLGCRQHHMPGALVQAPQRLEVVRETLPQIHGLADVQNSAGGIREP